MKDEGGRFAFILFLAGWHWALTLDEFLAETIKQNADKAFERVSSLMES
jgi:hypothetical protein